MTALLRESVDRVGLRYPGAALVTSLFVVTIDRTSFAPWSIPNVVFEFFKAAYDLKSLLYFMIEGRLVAERDLY